MTTREEMLETIRRYGVVDERVLAVLAGVDRAKFIAKEWKGVAYEDRPIPIGHEQTISQPYTVARMIELLVQSAKFIVQSSKVLEIGTGSGWQTGILAKLFAQVYSVEVIPEVAERAGGRGVGGGRLGGGGVFGGGGEGQAARGGHGCSS